MKIKVIDKGYVKDCDHEGGTSGWEIWEITLDES